MVVSRRSVSFTSRFYNGNGAARDGALEGCYRGVTASGGRGGPLAFGLLTGEDENERIQLENKWTQLPIRRRKALTQWPSLPRKSARSSKAGLRQSISRSPGRS